MTCPKFDEFERGNMSPKAFARHARDCRDCLAETDLDRRLSEETKRLRAPIAAPELWNRIESALQAEAAEVKENARTDRGRRRTKRFRFWPLLIPAASSFILVVAVTVFLPSKSVSGSGLLAQKILAQVEARETEYLDSIRALEQLARPKISAMDLQLMSLYRDRLAVIDAQIDKCREALGSNPANAHIRRYLMAALQDKKMTLTEALGS